MKTNICAYALACIGMFLVLAVPVQAQDSEVTTQEETQETCKIHTINISSFLDRAVAIQYEYRLNKSVSLAAVFFSKLKFDNSRQKNDRTNAYCACFLYHLYTKKSIDVSAEIIVAYGIHFWQRENPVDPFIGDRYYDSEDDPIMGSLSAMSYALGIDAKYYFNDWLGIYALLGANYNWYYRLYSDLTTEITDYEIEPLFLLGATLKF